MDKKTLVIGASVNTFRYSNVAIIKLVSKGFEVRALGNRKGKVEGVDIVDYKKKFKNIHTITLYLNARSQIEYYNYILGLRPKRVLFNPGSENSELEKLLFKNNIYFEKSCTLVMLSLGQY